MFLSNLTLFRWSLHSKRWVVRIAIPYSNAVCKKTTIYYTITSNKRNPIFKHNLYFFIYIIQLQVTKEIPYSVCKTPIIHYTVTFLQVTNAIPYSNSL